LPDKMGPCGGIDGLSPSRTAISIRDFGDSPKSFARHRLFRADLEQPIADRQFEKGDYLSAITDSGYAVCRSVEHRRCEQLTVDGILWPGGGPQRASDDALLLSTNQLLLHPDRTDKALMSLSPNGKVEHVVDLRKLQPTNVDSENIQISAVAPQRILYSATGCYLGDFDDCYGLNFERIAVFDSQTHQLLFQEKVGRNAISIISPAEDFSFKELKRERVSMFLAHRMFEHVCSGCLSGNSEVPPKVNFLDNIPTSRYILYQLVGTHDFASATTRIQDSTSRCGAPCDPRQGLLGYAH